MNRDLKNQTTDRYTQYWVDRNLELINPDHFKQPKPIWLEIGAGSGWFIVELARLYPESFLIAIERSRMRGKTLVHKTKQAGLENLVGFRGNAIPTLIHNVPSESIERLYFLYPCPWPKNSQRKNRWYLHPVMPHFFRVLKPGGLMIWASDQSFFIDEAKWVCEERYEMKTLSHGLLKPNGYNDLDKFPKGRSKFEASFMEQGQPCFELICKK
jgi:tRNA (guanine-N7-)-methyltransferase